MSYKRITMMLRGLFGRAAVEHEMDAEMRFHLEMESEKNIRQGMNPEAARRAALRVFGGVDRHQEVMRDDRGSRWLEDIARDLRFAARTFIRNPGFAVAAVVTLALAIGTNGAVFSIVNGLILRPFPVPHPERLVALWARDEEDGGAVQIGYDDYVDWRDRSGLFTGLAAQSTAPLSLSVDRSTEVMWSEVVSPNYFSVLGVRPVLGRFFVAGEQVGRTGSPLIVLSHDVWQQRFRGDSSVIGQVMRVNRMPFEVIGVAPGAFHGIRRFGFWPDLWVPLGSPGTRDLMQGRGRGSLIVVGRLRDGLDLERAGAQATVFAKALSEASPGTNRGLGAMLTSARAPFDSPRFVPPRTLVLASMLGLVGVGLILLIACANVANLMLARASGRQREMAVRLSIGGSRGRLLRQLLTESALLSLLGGLAALPLMLLAGRWQATMVPELQFRVGLNMSLDHRVLAFTALLTFAAVFLFGLIPSLQATRVDLISTLRGSDANRRARFRNFELRDLLVAGQLALSVILLVAGTLFLRSLRATRAADLGLEPANRVVISANPQVHGYDRARAIAYYDQASRRVNELPGIVSAAWAFPVPFDTYGRGEELYFEGTSDAAQRRATTVTMSVVEPRYFETIGTRLVSGREFTIGDSAGAPRVMIVSRVLAERSWPGRDALGQRARMGGSDGDAVQVVGVVEDAVYASPTQQRQPYAFFPVRQHSSHGLTLVVHARGDVERLLPRLKELLATTDPEVATYGALTMERSLRNALSAQESAASIAGILALLALVLAMVGLYGVVAYTVERRTREIGIRIALGATPASVVRLVLGHTGRTTLSGLGFGLVGAFGIGRAISSLLYGVSATDPLTFTVIPLALASVALLASYAPARRATRVHPSIALRQE